MSTQARYSTLIAALAGTMMMAGCSFAPPATPPDMKMPEHYATAPTANADDQRLAAGAPAVPDWWRSSGSTLLDEWVEEGLKNNPSLEAARKTLEGVQQQYRAQVGEALLPSLDAGGQVSRQRELGLPNLGAPTNLYNVYAGNLNLNYTFDLFGASRYGVRQVAAQVDEQSYRLAAARRALAANIVITAIRAAALAEQVDAMARLTALAQTRAELADKAYRLGAASHADMLAARQDAAATRESLPPLRAQALQARHALAVYLGRTPNDAPEVPPLSAFQLPAEVPLSLPSDLLRQRPDVLAAEASLQAASAQVGLATANMFPRLALSASLGTAAFRDSALFGPTASVWGAGLSFAQPLFHGGALRAERKAAQAGYDASVAQYRQTVLNAFQNVADTLVALEQDAATLDASRTAADAARQSFEETHARRQLGAVSQPQALASEQRWQSARLNLIRSTATRMIDTATLFQAMGEKLFPIESENVADKRGGQSMRTR